MRISASIEITSVDDIRVHARPGGGFHVVIGPAGGETVMLSFPRVATAEALAAVLTLAGVTHGFMGDALAAVADVLGQPAQRAAKGTHLALVPTDPDQPPPRAA